MLDHSLSSKLVAKVLWDSRIEDPVALENWDIILGCMISDLNNDLKNLGSFRENLVQLVRRPPEDASLWKPMTDAMTRSIIELYRDRGEDDYMNITIKAIARQVRISWHELITTDKMFRLGVWYGLIGAIHRRMR